MSASMFHGKFISVYGRPDDFERKFPASVTLQHIGRVLIQVSLSIEETRELVANLQAALEHVTQAQPASERA